MAAGYYLPGASAVGVVGKEVQYRTFFEIFGQPCVCLDFSSYDEES